MSHTFTLAGMAGTFTAAGSDPSAPDTSGTQVDPVVATPETYARLSLRPGTGPAPGLPLVASKNIVHTMPTPAILAGKPHTPPVFGQLGMSAAPLVGLGHMRGFADPDPVWTGSIWDPAVPDAPAGANFLRWSARQLPDPASHSNRYLLGTRVSNDNTTGLPSGAEQWDADAGSSFAIPWQSAYPFKPAVQNHIHYGEDGAVHTESAGVHFSPHVCSHMWADFGTILTPPFTVLAVLVMMSFPTRSYFNYVFDSGWDPGSAVSAATRDKIYRRGMSGNLRVSEAEGYRNGLRVGQNQMQGFTDMNPSTRLARVPFTHTLKPKMVAMVVNGAASRYYVYDTSGEHSKPITLINHGAQRLWVMGRRNGLLALAAASAMVVFEIRAWDKALNDTHLDAQFHQLRSTWNFAAYDREILNASRAMS